VVTVTKKLIKVQGLITLLLSINFSDYGATIVSKLKPTYVLSMVQLRLDHSILT